MQDSAQLLRFAVNECAAQERWVPPANLKACVGVRSRGRELVVESTRKRLAAGTLLQPAQLDAGLTAAARVLEASGSTAATALGVEEQLESLLAPEPNP